MPWLGSWLGGWVGSWLGSTKVPALGPDGRLLSFPMRDGVVVSMTWATDIIKAIDGTEHRAATMLGPRLTLAFAFDLNDDTEITELRGELFRYPADLRLIPLRWDSLRIRDLANKHLTVPAGQIALWDWGLPGQRVYIFNDDGQGYEAVLQEADPLGTLIKVDEGPTSGTYLDGEVFIAPLVQGYLYDGNTIQREQVNAGTWQGSATITFFPSTAPAGITIDTYDGNYLLLDSITPTSDLANEKIAAGIQAADHGAIYRQRTLRDNSDIARVHSITARGRAEIQWWRAFFWTLQGRFETFLLPTFRDDYELFDPLDGSNTVLIVGELGGVPDYVTNWFPSASHRYLRFEYDDGTIVYRKVTAAVDNGDGSQELTLDDTLDVGTITRISAAEVCRLASDQIDITYYLGDQIELELQALAVQQ